MRFKQIFPVSLVAIGVAMASNFAPAQAESRTAPTLKISCVSSKASDVSCSWTGIPPGFFTRWTLLRSDGRAFFAPPSQMSYTDALVKPGATYSYLVWAYNEGVGVARSDSATVLVFAPDAVPTTLAPLEPPKVVVKPTGDAPTTTTIEAVKQEISIFVSSDTSKPPITTVTTQPPVTETAKTEPTTPRKTEPTRPPVTIPAPKLPGAPEATQAPTSVPATTPTTTPTTPATTPKAEITSDTKPADSPDATHPPITTPDSKPINKPEATRPPVTTVAPKKTSKDAKSKGLTLKGKSQGVQAK